MGECLEMSYASLLTLDDLRIYLISNSLLVSESDHWMWTGNTLGEYGYTNFRFRGEQFAHRLSWIAFKGKIPDGKWVRHKCDVKGCINPKHLLVGFPVENSQDTMERHPTWRYTMFGGKIPPPKFPSWITNPPKWPAWRRI